MVEKEREREKDDCVERERDGAKEKRGKNAPIKSFASIWGRMKKKKKERFIEQHRQKVGTTQLKLNYLLMVDQAVGSQTEEEGDRGG